jgi:DNA repair protein RecN (Recombination protein N)
LIESISIRNLGVISHAQLELSSGFTALTGETGAGKTMVLTALNLLLGGRADSTAIRTGETQLSVSGIWRLADQQLIEELAELGADISSGELVVSRTLTSDGRSRAILGGVAVPISTLAQFAERLVAVHGQSDQIRLKSAAAQRAALDSFARTDSEIAAYQQAFTQYRDLQARMERMVSSSAQDEFRMAQIREQISAIENLSPLSGELAELSEKVNRLSNVESLREAAAVAHDAISSDSEIDVLQGIGIARKALESSSDPQLRELGDRAHELGSLAQDIASELASYLHSLDADPAQLEYLLNRRAELVTLERKYGKSVDELLADLPGLQAELLDLDSSDEQIERLEMQLEAALSQLSFAGAALSDRRRAAAVELAQRISAELEQLAMAGSKVEIRVSSLEDFEQHGNDRIEFLLSAFAGAEPRPLAKGASGGELSRIMLAIELVLAGPSALPTMIFDEVDAGVGGQAAVELGKRLAKLAASAQVLVVTHLAQVAAFANHQIRVMKNSSGAITESSTQALSGADREVELARMLSGNPDSEVAIQHAKELLQSR